MRLSIEVRLILAMNVLVVGVGVAVGWSAVAVSGRAIEHRLVDESARNAASIFRTMQLPLSDTMLSRLGQILGAEVAAGPFEPPEIDATSLPEPKADALRRAAAGGLLRRRIALGTDVYLVGTAPVTPMPTALPIKGQMCLYLLVPESQIEAAKRASARTIIWVTVGAIVAATVLAYWLSRSILRPLQRLATRMDALSEQAIEKGTAIGPAAPETGPAEIMRLGRSFDRLLGRLGEARRRLARSARLATLGQLSASVAHELRNPLTGIRMNARVLADELASAGKADSGLERIITEADRMNLYLEELLSLAGGGGRDESPHDLATLPTVNLAEVCESVLSLVERRCRHAGVAVHRQWDAGRPIVRADEQQIRQVILNLVLNALDAMPSGGTLTVSVQRGATGTLRFSVTDTGRGVHVADGADVFEPFVTTKPGGVGLGLYVCRRNVERHRGRIGYDSSDSGATFWFELPAAAD